MNLILELAYTLKAFLDQGSEKRGFGFKTSSTLMGSLWVIMVQLWEMKNQTEQWATQQQPPLSDSLERRSRDWGYLNLASGGKGDLLTMLHGSCCVKKAVYKRTHSTPLKFCGIFPLCVDLNHIRFLSRLSAQWWLPWRGLQETFAEKTPKPCLLFLVDNNLWSR